MDIKKAEMALLTAFILFLAPMAVYAGNGEMKDTLGQNDKLRASEELKSSNGKYTLRMQDDGNLVAHDNQGKVLWSSNTNGSGAIECVLQSDGNLLLKDRNGRVVWATNTDGYKNAKLVIQDDGNLVIYNERGSAVWAKGRIKDSLSRGENLLANEFIRSQNRKYTLVLQGDGNLVAHDNQRNALWSSNTDGSGAVECVLQSNGNLLLKDRNGRVVWATNTDGYSNATLLIEDDGNVVLYKERGAAFWSNGKTHMDIERDAPPAGAPARVRHQDDAGSGRDAGNVLKEAVPIYPATEPVDGELSPADGIDLYSIRLDRQWRLLLKLMNQSGQDYNLALLKSNGDILASSARRTGQSESLDFTAPASGTYYIRVSRKAGQGHYKIELSIHKQESIKDSLSTGENLLANDFLRSQNRKYALRMQEDGNLVAYDSQGNALWSSNTDGSGAIECVLQSDGNLLLKDRNGRVVWATSTDGYNNAKLVIQDDGNLVIYNERGLAVWTNGRIKDSLSNYNANTGDNEFDNALSSLNEVAHADLDNFMNKLSDTFGISKPWIENLVRRENIPPADVYMIARTASVTNRPIGTVENYYMANRGQGWGVIAQRLGIKPGSKEFHALKKDDKGLLSKEKSQGQKKKDKDKR